MLNRAAAAAVLALMVPALLFPDSVWDLNGTYRITNRASKQAQLIFRLTHPSETAQTRILKSTLLPPGNRSETANKTQTEILSLKIPAKSFCDISLKITCDVSAINVFSNETFWVEDISENDAKLLTLPSAGIESTNPDIRKLAVSLSRISQTDRETYENFVKKVRELYQPGKPLSTNSGALAFLRKKSFSALSCAQLAAALCRSQGIPAKVFTLVPLGKKTAQREAAMVEAFIRGWGFVPAVIGDNLPVGEARDIFAAVNPEMQLTGANGAPLKDGAVLPPVWNAAEVK